MADIQGHSCKFDTVIKFKLSSGAVGGASVRRIMNISETWKTRFLFKVFGAVMVLRIMVRNTSSLQPLWFPPQIRQNSSRKQNRLSSEGERRPRRRAFWLLQQPTSRGRRWASCQPSLFCDSVHLWGYAGFLTTRLINNNGPVGFWCRYFMLLFSSELICSSSLGSQVFHTWVDFSKNSLLSVMLVRSGSSSINHHWNQLTAAVSC